MSDAPPSARPRDERRPSEVLDFLLRLAFFATAPVLLFACALRVPIGGAIANVAVVLAVFFSAAAIRSASERRPWLRRLFRRPLSFEDHYRNNPPKPFLYYVFYAVLFPFWIGRREARREFAVFRGYTAFGVVVLVVSGAYQYFTKWRPELGFGEFCKALALVTLIELVISLTMLMPIATTVVHYDLSRRHGRLAVLVAVTVVVFVITAIGYAKKRHASVAITTSRRMVLRTRARPQRALAVRTEGLRLAAAALHYGEGEIAHDSRIEEEILGEPIDAARGALGRLYKSDETDCFHLVSFRVKNRRILVLYGDPDDPSEKVIWTGIRGLGELVVDDAELPPHAFGIMRRTSRK